MRVCVTDWLEPLYVAVITADVVVVTCAVEPKYTQLLTPAGIVIVAGTVTSAGLLLDRATSAPPGGATALNLTSPPRLEPPCMLGELTVTELTVTEDGGAVVVVVSLSLSSWSVSSPCIPTGERW